MRELLSLRKILVFAPELRAARRFYGEVLGLRLERAGERVLQFRGANFDLDVFACESAAEFDHYSERAGSSVAFAVPCLETAISELAGRGVRFLHAVPNEGPTGERYVAFVDPFGTVFELMETAAAGREAATGAASAT